MEMNKKQEKKNAKALFESGAVEKYSIEDMQPTPEEIKRVMRWMGKNSGKNMTPEQRRKRAIDAVKAREEKRKLSTTSIVSNS